VGGAAVSNRRPAQSGAWKSTPPSTKFESAHPTAIIHWLPTISDVLDRIRESYAALPASIHLRAANALHLATATVQGFPLISSNDVHLLAAPGQFGLKGGNIISQLDRRAGLRRADAPAIGDYTPAFATSASKVMPIPDTSRRCRHTS
jgi:hypothetical protein